MAKAPRYVVYHKASTMEARRFVLSRPAERHAEKLNVSYPGQYAVAPINYYQTKIVHMVERVNLMSGEKYMEPSNTPNYCSPASEAYWSM